MREEGYSSMPPNPLRADFYRREAARLHRLAGVASLPEVRRNLLRTARLYEAMARRAAEHAPVTAAPQDDDAAAAVTAAERPTDSRTRDNS